MTPAEKNIFLDMAKELLLETEAMIDTKNNIDTWHRATKIHRLSAAIAQLSKPEFVITGVLPGDGE